MIMGYEKSPYKFYCKCGKRINFSPNKNNQICYQCKIKNKKKNISISFVSRRLPWENWGKLPGVKKNGQV